jgi:hypothetical protein
MKKDLSTLGWRANSVSVLGDVLELARAGARTFVPWASSSLAILALDSFLC